MKEASHRVVFLGASNLTISFPVVLEISRRLIGGPLEVLAACGHGRSYGMQSRVLGGALPGILPSGLWEALANSPPAPTFALITDVGNDILYGASVAEIGQWVEAGIKRLQKQKALVVMTLLPLESLASLQNWRFIFMRTLLFPMGRLRLETVLERARELDVCLRKLGTDSGIKLVAQKLEWYGFDPIHILRSHREAVWNEILGSWKQTSEVPCPPPIRLPRLLPAHRWFFGLEQRHVQPTARLADGTNISLY